MVSRDRTKDSSVSLCMDFLHSDTLRDGYSVDVGVQADRFVCLFVFVFVSSFVRSFVRLFVRSFVRSFVRLFVCRMS